MKNLNYLRKFKGISLRLFISFFLLLSLFLVKQFSVQRQLTQEENTSATINTAGRQLSMAILDLDYFKRVNDQFGHPVGDKVLRDTASLVKSTILDSDYAIRIGGEEFLIFMVNTSLEEAKKRVENIRQRLENFMHPKVGIVTASMGLVEREKEEDYLSVYNRVDDALYAAKENGRNQVCSL